MIDGDEEAARKERLEESDRWIPTFTRSKDLETASNNSVEWPHLAVNGRKGGEFYKSALEFAR
jgi:hypothetical protein